MDPNTIWTVAAVLVPVLAGFAFGLAAMTPASFHAARVCFWLSAVTLCACASIWTWWSGFAYRFLIGGPVIVFSGVALIVCLRWVDLRAALATERDDVAPVKTSGMALGPQIAINFKSEPNIAVDCLHIHNHGNRGAFNIRALITVPDSGLSMSIYHEQLAAEKFVTIKPDKLFMSGRAMTSSLAAASVITFFLSARQTAHAARAEAQDERICAARNVGDDATDGDIRTSIDGIFAISDTLTHLGSDEVVPFNVTYRNFEETLQYSAPHVLTITAKGDLRIARIGPEPPPVAISMPPQVVSNATNAETNPKSVSAQPSIVVQYEFDFDDEEETFNEYLHLRNIGTSPATNVTILPLKVLGGRKINLGRVVEAMAPNDPEIYIRVLGLRDALDRIRGKIPPPLPGSGSATPIHLRLTIQFSDRMGQGREEAYYVVTQRGRGPWTIEITKFNPHGPAKWTDLAALDA